MLSRDQHLLGLGPWRILALAGLVMNYQRKTLAFMRSLGERQTP